MVKKLHDRVNILHVNNLWPGDLLLCHCQTVETMAAMKAQLPAGASWASFGIGRGQMPMAAASVALGGNVRVGLEDNIYLERGVLATNAQLVTKAREIIERMGGRVGTPQEARNKLNLRGADG